MLEDSLTQELEDASDDIEQVIEGMSILAEM